MGPAGLCSPFGLSLEPRRQPPQSVGTSKALCAGRLTYLLLDPSSHRTPLPPAPPAVQQPWDLPSPDFSMLTALSGFLFRLHEFIFLITVGGPGSHFLPRIS